MKLISPPLTVFAIIVFIGCALDPEVPPIENEEEIITDVVLTFTPEGGNPIITAVARDPDGEGPDDLQIVNHIVLDQNTEYLLNLELTNSVAGESITEEVEEEADEHLFFFSWTTDTFNHPTGDGNVDNRADPVLYEDEDENGLPLGILTSWTTGPPRFGAQFRVILKHQPDTKSANSTVNIGETDLDITWNLEIQ